VVAGFRITESNGLAGGPVEVESFVEYSGNRPIYLAVFSDRAKERLADVSFSAALEGTDVSFDDPASSLPDLGGPATAVELRPEQPLRQLVLVNDFLTLERAATALKPGGSASLVLTCQRRLAMGDDAEEAMSKRDAPVAKVTLTIDLRRDDRTLEALIARLAADLREGRDPLIASRERTLAQLVALRSPLALPHLESLEDHPDPLIRNRVAKALEHLRDGSSG
jgi:hypothetical protein